MSSVLALVLFFGANLGKLPLLYFFNMLLWGFLVAQMVKSSPAMWEVQVRSPGLG